MPPFLQSWDLTSLLAVRSFHDQTLVYLSWLVASLSWKGWLWWLIAAVLWVRGRRQTAVQFVLSLLTGTLAIIGLKGIISRPRPDFYAAQQLNLPMPELLPTVHSFPSGHTLLAAGIAYLVTRRYGGWRAAAAWLFVVAVGLARVYQGLHWPTDIIGSVILGVVSAWPVISLSQLPPIKRFTQARAKQRAPERTLAGVR